MKSFNRIFAVVIGIIVLLFIGANCFLLSADGSESGRPYRVEISRLAHEIESDGLENIDLSECEYVTNIERFSEKFYDTDSDYSVREIHGELYRFDYLATVKYDNSGIVVMINLILVVMAVTMLCVMLFLRRKILVPFETLVDVPYELSKGNLTTPLKESRSRFFGRFIWGVDLLRENMEQQKQRELELQKEKKTLLLSISHDIKTPLSAIKLYSKALSKGLYPDRGKQLEIAESIDAKADEIEEYVSRIISASKEDFLSLEVRNGEFYLSELMGSIKKYYKEKLALVKTEFSVAAYADCLIKGDIDRGIEVLQNVMENAIKYGDGRRIDVNFSEEDGCVLISVSNSGCKLSDIELPHIFESFWRGANAENAIGSGLGLYICRQLMHKMNGEIFANIRDGFMTVTMVFAKA